MTKTVNKSAQRSGAVRVSTVPRKKKVTKRAKATKAKPKNKGRRR